MHISINMYQCPICEMYISFSYFPRNSMYMHMCICVVIACFYKNKDMYSPCLSSFNDRCVDRKPVVMPASSDLRILTT